METQMRLLITASAAIGKSKVAAVVVGLVRREIGSVCARGFPVGTRRWKKEVGELLCDLHRQC